MPDPACDCNRHLPNVRVIGRVAVSVLERAAALEQIFEIVRSGRPQLVTFCNAHTVNLAAHDKDFAAALASFMILNDGVGVDIASRVLYGRAFPCNLAGTDFVPALLDTAPLALRIFLVGSSAEVVAKAAATLQARYPRHIVVGAHHGFFSTVESASIASQIEAAVPHLVLVGMGQPRQELWSVQNLATAPTVTMCVGALLEFTAGTVPRAPQWMRSARLEWLYRLALEPRRLARRYLIGNVEFMGRVFRDYARQRRSSRRTQRKC